MKSKKSSSWVFLVLGILFVVFAVLMAVSESEMIFGTKVSNINKLLQQGTVESNVGSYVELDVDAVLDNYAETVHKWNGITTGKDQHYLVWLDDDSMIALSARKKLVEPLDAIMEKTWDYVEGKTDSFTNTPLHVKGKIVKMSTEMRKYYQDSLDYFGLTSADRDIYYYQIDCTDSQLMMIVILAFFVVMAVLMFVLFFANRTAVKRAALQAEMQADMGYTYPTQYTTYGADVEEAPQADETEFQASEGTDYDSPDAAE